MKAVGALYFPLLKFCCCAEGRGRCPEASGPEMGEMMMRDEVGGNLVWRSKFVPAGGFGLAILGVLAALGSAGMAQAAEPAASGPPGRPTASLDMPSKRSTISRDTSTRRRTEDAQRAGKPATSPGVRDGEDGPTMCDGSKL